MTAGPCTPEIQELDPAPSQRNKPRTVPLLSDDSTLVTAGSHKPFVSLLKHYLTAQSVTSLDDQSKHRGIPSQTHSTHPGMPAEYGCACDIMSLIDDCDVAPQSDHDYGMV